mmetsp:Transcript_71598/g.215215  ORF Transcript_71598/g.215215 Transcript_71598/m.215215 type:complete len:200 (-) Transcript_71598:97-696(-)
MAMYDSGRIGCAIGPASCANCADRMMRTSSMRLTASEVMSAEKCWSRKTVSPSLSVSWNQSRHVTRLPVQLWKYSWAMMPSTRRIVASVAISGVASTHLELKMFSDLFSIAPMLKSATATMLKTSRSYSRPNCSSSHAIAFLMDAIAKESWSSKPFSVKIASATSRPPHVRKVLRRLARSPATRAKRYDGLGHGSMYAA